jgi:hypothetical protein
LCRLAVLFRRPLHEVAQWPAAEIRLVQHYLSKKPSVEERIEIGMARMRQLILSRWNKDARVPDLTELLDYHDPWPDEPTEAMKADESRYSEVDRSFLARL